MKAVRALPLLVLLVCPALAGEAGFTSKPSATRAGGETRIAFAVSAPVDVEVAVLDAKGQVVRHLGGGLLGENSPQPFKKGLAQEVVWDGKDDLGKPAGGGPFKIRVGLGLAAEFDKVLAWSGENVEDVRGLCCGPDGTLYLTYGGQHYAHRRATLISAFDRNGKYLRQVLPGPGGLPAEKRKGWPHVKLESGREVPVVWHTLARAVNPGVVFGDRCFPTATADGRIVVLNSVGTGFARVSEPDYHGGRRLLIVGADGSVPENFLGPEVCKDQPQGAGWVAISPDGKYAYVSGLGGGSVKKKTLPVHHVVYRVPMDGSQPGEVFAGKLNQPGSGKDGLNNPLGVAVDKVGNVYVSDHGNNRIAVFDPAGRFLKEIAVQGPWQVLVSRRTGAIYATAEKGAKIVKLGGLAAPSVKASMPTPGFKPDKISYNVMIALDDSVEPHAVWLLSRRWHGGKLRKLLDKGASFEDLGDMIGKKVKKNAAINFSAGLAAAGGKLVTLNTAFGYNWSAKQIAFDLETGAPLGLFFKRKGKVKVNEIVAGKDGRLYTIGGGYKKPCPVNRFDTSGGEIPFPAENPIKGFWHGHTRTFGMFADRRGGIYLVGGDAYRALSDATVRRYGPDGKLIDKQAVKAHHAYLGGIAADSRGNIYLGAQVVPKGQHTPPWFGGKLPKATEHGYPVRAYQHCGSVVKFAPSGGAIVKDPAGKYTATKYTWKQTHTVSLKNGSWVRRGGLIPRRGPGGAHCFCETSRFDIDGYDRLFVPDVHRFCVRVLDAAGNEIALIGSYGNMDNRGPDSKHPEPEIAYGWPLVTQVAGDRLYVADLTNRRIAVARLKCRLEETCAAR